MSRATSSPLRSFELKCSEFKVVCLREDRLEDDLSRCDTPERAAEYYRKHISTSPHYSEDVETAYVLLLNTRHRPKGHSIVATGTLDTLFLHPREVFRPAFVSGSASVVLFHNHPSGDPTPSAADIRVTRDLIRAAVILKIEITDHIVMGRVSTGRPKGYASLRELGYFYGIGESESSPRSGSERAAKPACKPPLSTGEMEFADLVKAAQKWKQWSDLELSRQVGCYAKTIQAVLSGQRRPDEKLLARLKSLVLDFNTQGEPAPREATPPFSTPEIAA